MPKLKDIVNQPEGRRLEFKEDKIELSWKEPGIAFRVTFVRKNYQQPDESQPELQPELQQELQQESLYGLTLMMLIEKPLNTKELSQKIGQREISGQLRKVLRKLHKDQLIENSIPENPNHPAQKHQLTEMGKTFIKLLADAKNQGNI